MQFDEKKIVFFDGVCNLCNTSVDFIIRHNTKRNIYIAPLQGQTAKELLPLEKTQNLNSLVFYEHGKVYDHSTGALKIARNLRTPLNLMYVFIIIPKFMRDTVYNFIAKNRYKWFGKKDSCRLPSDEEKRFFLN